MQILLYIIRTSIYRNISVFFKNPSAYSSLSSNRQISILRELTKRYESVFRTTLAEALRYYEVQDPRGEYVLVIEGRSRAELEEKRQKSFLKMSVKDHVGLYEGQGMDRKAAMKQAAKDRGISKREIYQALLSEEEG